ERLVELDAKLAKVLTGEAKPKDAAEQMELVRLCWGSKHLTAAAARLSAGAFAVDPKLAEDPRSENRYNAACAAALAGCGTGKDAGQLEDPERARLRRQAVSWLRADLAAWRTLLSNDPDKLRPIVRKMMDT